ncbi:MAG: serine/threonine-protein kinase, partial [Bacteroidota bacterium]
MIGKTISHYKILEKLGGGGMGVVYKALDLKLDRSVALKFLPPSFSNDEETKQRFIHEAKSASSLQHYNICTIHEIDETDEGQLFICMDLYEGETLKKKIKKGSIKTNDIVEIAIQIAKGLEKAHEKEIVHRDIKPANIFVRNDGTVKILDFGLAKSALGSTMTQLGSTMGTIAYMSPEQSKGEEVDHRTDIWSLGVVMYEMLTEKLPFKGEYDSAIIYSIVNEEPDLINKYRSDIPSELLHILNRALEKDPEERYQSVNDMLIDLKRLKRDTSGASKISDNLFSSEIKRSERNLIKNKTVIIPAIILFVIIITLIGYFITFHESEDYKPIPIAVIDFVNETNEAELNGLSGMLITALEQSKRLSVLTRSRMFDILKQLKISDIDRIDESLGRKICNEAKVNTLAAATIRKFGNLYTIDFKVMNVDKNEYLFTSKEEGEG